MKQEVRVKDVQERIEELEKRQKGIQSLQDLCLHSDAEEVKEAIKLIEKEAEINDLRSLCSGVGWDYIAEIDRLKKLIENAVVYYEDK